MPNPTFGAANLQWVGVATETVYGTAIALPSTYFPAESPTWKVVQADMVDTALRGSMGGEFQQLTGLRHDEISFKTHIYLDSIFPLLRGILGLPDVIVGAADPYSHKTSLQNGNNGQPASTTVFWSDGVGKTWQMPGAQLSSVKIAVKVDGLVDVDVTYIGLPAVPITSPTNTPTTMKPMPSWNSIITIGGIALTKYSEVNFEIKRATEAIGTVTGTQAPFAIFAGPVTVSGSLTGIYQGSTDNDLTAMIVNSQPVLLVKISPANDAVHSIAFQMSVVAYDSAEASGTNKWMEIKSAFKALTNPTDVAGGGNQSPMLVTMLSATATAI